MNRALRRATQADLRKRASEWSVQLTPIPESEWPPPKVDCERPVAVWRSREFFVQLVEAAPFQGIEVLRMSVNRCTLGGDGHWKQNIPWDDLQRCKREIGFGDWYGIEIYPRERDLVQVANMRHLWLLAQPLGIGWFEGRAVTRKAVL